MRPDSARGSKRRMTSGGRKHQRTLTLVALGTIVCGVNAPWARADDWNNPAGGVWQVGSNWLDGTTPTASDWAFFENDVMTTGTVTFSGNGVSQGLTLKNTTGVITFDVGAGNTWTQSLYTILGDGATPALQKPSMILASGTVICNLFLEGNNNHTEAHVTVTGPTSLYNATGGVRVGSDSGSNSTLTLSNGGRVLSGTTAFLGLQTATGCQLNIQDSGSKMTVNAGLQVGGGIDGFVNGGQHQINITNGGVLETGQFLVAVGGTNAQAPGNTVTVSGAGSQLTLTAKTSPSAFSTLAAAVGFNNNDNTLNVNNSGSVVVNQGDVRVGNAATSVNNLVHVTSGSVTMNGTGDLATSGSGRFDVRRGKLWLEGGTATLPGLLANTGPTSLLQLDGGTLIVNNANVANGAPVSLGNGSGLAMIYRMASLAGMSTFVDGLNIQSDGQLQGSGGITGNVTNGGIIAPGTSPGTINITGNVAQTSGGAMNIELGGTGAGQYDLINATGNLSLAGVLNVTLTGGYTPSSGDFFDFLNGSSRSGIFNVINTPPVSGGAHWDITYTPTGVIVTYAPEPASICVLLGGGGAALLLRRRNRRGGDVR